MKQMTNQQNTDGYTVLEMLFVTVLIGIFMMIAYQQMQQSAYRRNVATLHGSVNTLQYAMTQYFYENCKTIYATATTNLQLSDLAPYYPSQSTAVANPFNPNNPQDFTLSFTRASKTDNAQVATKATIVVRFTFANASSQQVGDRMGKIAASVRPTNYSTTAKTMTWTFSPFRSIANTGISQSSRASLAVYNIWSSGQDISGADKESCDYLEYYYQTH